MRGLWRRSRSWVWGNRFSNVYRVCRNWFIAAFLVPLVLNAQEQAARTALPSAVRVWGRNIVSNMSNDSAGVIISKDGLVLTCKHVVDDTDELTILVHDRAETIQYEARVIKTDSSMDLALIQVTGQINPKDFVPIEMADELPEPGTQILAIGNPLEFGRTVSAGIVSMSGFEKGVAFFFIDAPVRKGFSGGPIVNREGRLLGIAVKQYLDGAFAECVPTSEIKRFLNPNLKEGDLQIRTRITEAGLESFGIGRALEVLESNPEALVKPGDIILTCDDYPVQDPDDLVRIVRRKPVGSTCELSILRNGEFMILKPVVKGATNL